MIRSMLARLFYGRYGSDQLNLALTLTLVVLYLATALTRLAVLYWLGLVIAAVILLRSLSRNFPQRRRENQAFLRLVGPAAAWVRLRRTAARDKEHRYFRCPGCGQQLRVPRGKGKITVTCRSCGAVFQEKS